MGMVTTGARRVAAAVALAAAVTGLGSACGSGDSSDGSPPSATTPVASAPGSTAPGATTPASTAPGTSSPATPSGGASGGTGGSGGSTASAPTSWDGLGSRAVYFSASDRVPLGVHEVLRGRAALARFTARVTATDAHAASAIAAATRSTDFSRSVLVVWTTSTGCSRATSAALHVTGNRVQVHISAPKPPPECVVADRLTVVFDAPKDKVPAQPQFG